MTLCKVNGTTRSGWYCCPALSGKALRLALPALAAAGLGVSTPASAQQPPAADYYVYVGAESADLLHRIRFGPDGAVLDRTIAVGEMATETEGPHGLNISPDGQRLADSHMIEVIEVTGTQGPAPAVSFPSIANS